MGQRIEFFIPGTPKPGGSKQGFVLRKGGKIITRPNGAPIVIMKEDSNNADWKANCAFFARQAFDSLTPIAAAMQVEVTFVMPRPKSHYHIGKRAGQLRADAPHFHTNTPDATKLMRSTEDAMTGIAWADDKLIARQFAEKVYGEKTGAQVVITELINQSTDQRDVGSVPAPLFEMAGT